MEQDLTDLLIAWSHGDEASLCELMPRVYGELYRMAQRQMRGERSNHTLQPTALIHEAYLQLIDQRAGWKNRKHFFAIAAKCMRRIVLKHARQRVADKRGGGMPDVPIDQGSIADRARPVELLDLDRALERLAKIEPRQVEIMELRFYGGFACREIADLLEISESTVNREWKLARGWLTCALEG